MSSDPLRDRFEGVDRDGNGVIDVVEFGTLGMSVKVQVDRRAVDDLRNLIVLVIIIECVCVQRQRTIEQRVLGAEFERIDKFRVKRERMGDLYL